MKEMFYPDFVVPDGKNPILPLAESIEELKTSYHAASKARACVNAGAEMFVEWYNATAQSIRLVYGKDSFELEYLRRTNFGASKNGSEDDSREFQRGMERVIDALADWISVLTKLNKQRSLRPAVVVKAQQNSKVSSLSDGADKGMIEKSNKIFIVHGHDETLRNKVESVLTKLGLQPIVLRNQPNKFKTIIEKFEDFADVGFAVILLTSDDVGYDKNKPECKKGRARQNVVLEMGYFWGKLGRDRMMAISDCDVELPGDISGVVYTDRSNDAQWQKELIHELKAAGYEVDSNKLF